MTDSTPNSPLDETEHLPCPDHPDDMFEGCEIQRFYARLLSLLLKLGFVFLLLTFAVYISGILVNYVPRHLLPRYWSLPLRRYLEVTQGKTGWNWLHELHHGDYLNLLPIAFLASISIICLAAVIIKFFRNREPYQGIIALLEVLVLAVAASGFLIVGGP